MEVIHLNAQSFDKLLENKDKDILVDFWAEWCGPCKMMGPVLNAFAGEHPEWIVGKVNVDDNMDLAARYSIDSIPALFHIKNGTVVHKIIGYRTKGELARDLGL